LAVEKLHISQFISIANLHPVLDVRSPGEFAHAHIPGAYSLPLFTDEERKVVGTTYKQRSRQEAIMIGLDYFGPKMRKMVEDVEQIVRNNTSKNAKNATDKTVVVHCWRGGMRSAAVAWLLDLYGFKVYALAGGYKFFRRWVLEQFEVPRAFRVVGGYTGSGKTELLKQVGVLGETIVDLEAIANHKGSAFGNIGMPPQPTQEMFENLLAMQLHASPTNDHPRSNGNNHVVELQIDGVNKRIWIEDESQRIGTVNIPAALWQQMRNAKLFFIDIPFSERLKHILEEYGKLDKDKMIAAVERIQKRLGGLETKMVIEYLEEGKYEDAFRILLKYYDKWYARGLINRNKPDEVCTTINMAEVDPFRNAKELIKQIKNIEPLKKLIDEPGS
jgi:tRNA 2-selenouridine synthase